MDGIILNESKVALLETSLVGVPWSRAVMGLSTTPGPFTTRTGGSSLLAGEITVAGYSRQSLTGWGTPAIDATDVCTSQAAPLTFLNTGPSDSPAIYSWFVVDSGTGLVIEAGAYDVPFVLAAGVGSYTTTPFASVTNR
jgi:hypothetical protein